MIVKTDKNIPFETESAYPGIQKKFYIGKNDGSNEIIMRYFVVEPGKSTPYHQHPFQHLVKIERGEGVAVDSDGNETPIGPGSLVYVKDNELHCFKNTGNQPFEFICIVPERGEK